MTEWHRAFSLSIPIPIPIATPIALRRCLGSVVWVIHEPLLRIQVERSAADRLFRAQAACCRGFL
jgi:hypothetical protein